MRVEKQIHTAPGIQLIRVLAHEGIRIFTSEKARELAPRAGLSEGYLRQALHHLARSGWIVRLRKGLYALSSSVPGATPVHEYEVAMALVDPAAISHWSALHYHGLTQQIPRRVYVLTTAGVTIPREQGSGKSYKDSGYSIDDVIYQFIQVKKERFFGTEKVWIGDAQVTITDVERTLLDGLARPQYFGDFAEVLNAFEALSHKLNIDRIIEYSLNLDAATIKRLGWILERQDISTNRLTKLAGIPIKGYRILDPTGPRKGPTNRRWMIQVNLPGNIKR